MGPAEEDFPTLKRDEEFAKDVFGVFKDGSREKIREKILDRRLSLALKCPEFGVSLASKLLTQVTNGDKIVLEKLDQCITTIHDDPNHEDHGVRIDYRYLVDDDSRNFFLLKDILEVPRSATVDIMDHPVITTFITRRWPRFLFLIMSLVYCLFVATFTAHLLFIFSRHDDPFGFGKECSDGEWNVCKRTLETALGGKNENKRDFNQTTDCTRACLGLAPFQACYKNNNDPLMCASEVALLLSIIVLLAQEIWQIIALGADYFREAENFFEWFIIVLAFVILLFIRKSEWLSAISSITVLLAWIQLIFILGRLPSYMGEFSLMYYASVKKVLMIALGFFFMILAFGLAFFFLHFEFTKGKGGTIFTTLPKALITSFVWFMGGVDLDSLWAESKDGIGGGEVEIIAMVLLMAMMLFGTLIMFNLIVATIITDMAWLKEEAKDTNLRNQASNAVQAGVATKPFHRGNSWEKEQLELWVCLHSVCGPCGKENVTDDEKLRILGIIEKGKGQKSSAE